MSWHITFSKNLQVIRKYHGLTQRDLGRALGGILKTTICGWETAIRRPMMKHLWEIHIFTGLPWEYIMGEKELSLSWYIAFKENGDEDPALPKAPAIKPYPAAPIHRGKGA